METDAAQADREEGAATVLTASQARVLGCLIEKETATPDAYPLTVNAAHTAANQKTARDPVMTLDQGEVHHALRELERLGLARQSFTSRAERYAHRADVALSLTPQQTVLLGLLLLRGAQTAHELLARAERATRFDNADDVRHHMERMAGREPALVVHLPRAGGQREDRYMHLLAGPVEQPAAVARVGTADTKPVGSLAGRVEALEQAVADLQARLDRIELQSQSQGGS